MKHTTLDINIDGETTTLQRECPFCNKIHSVVVDTKKFNDGMKKYNDGMYIQNAFPDFTPYQREMILTGICNDCWNCWNDFDFDYEEDIELEDKE